MHQYFEMLWARKINRVSKLTPAGVKYEIPGKASNISSRIIAATLVTVSRQIQPMEDAAKEQGILQVKSPDGGQMEMEK